MLVILASVLVYAISFLLLRALSRYREFAADRGSRGAHRAPERARLGADEDQRHDRARARARTCAAAEGMSAFFIVPARAKKLADEPLRRPPAARAAPGRAVSASSRSCRAPPDAVGLRDILTGRPQVKGPAPDRLFAISTAYVTLETEYQIDPAGRRRDRLPGARDERLRSDAEGHGGGRRRPPAATAARPSTTAGRQLRLPLDGAAHRAARRASKTSPSGSTASRARSRRPATASGCCARCSPSRTRRRSSRVYFIYNYKRGNWYPFVPAPGDDSSARPSASCSSRRRSAANCRSSPSSSAGSRCGGSRSDCGWLGLPSY